MPLLNAILVEPGDRVQWRGDPRNRGKFRVPIGTWGTVLCYRGLGKARVRWDDGVETTVDTFELFFAKYAETRRRAAADRPR